MLREERYASFSTASVQDRRDFKDEIFRVLNTSFRTHRLPLARAWVPCVLNHKCLRGHDHVNSVSILETAFQYSTEFRFFLFEMASSSFHMFKGEGVVGKAFMTNQPFFSTDIASSYGTEDPISSCARANRIHNAAIAIPLQSSIHNTECILEFLFPFDFKDQLEEQKKMVSGLFSTLQQCCKTLFVVSTDTVLERESNIPAAFQVLHTLNTFEQSGANGLLFPKGDSTAAADPKRVMQLLPEPSDLNKNGTDRTPSIKTTQVFDAIGLGSLDANETGEEGEAAGEKAVNVPVKSTRGLLECSESKCMHLFQQCLKDKNYGEFKAEISEVLKSALETHRLPVAQAWVPCIQNPKCLYGQTSHVNSVSILEVACGNYPFNDSRLFRYRLASSFCHLVKSGGIVGKAFGTNQPFFSTNIAQTYGVGTAAVAVPLQSIIHNADCILEFILPFDCTDLQEQKNILTALFSTLKQCCKTLRVVTDEVIEERSNAPLPIFQVLQPSSAVEQSGENDMLLLKENPREADPSPGIISGFISKPPSQRLTSDDLWPDLNKSGSKRCFSKPLRSEIIDLDNGIVTKTSLKDAKKFTGGKSTGSAGIKRDWAWQYCSSIPGNSNGVICSFCNLEIKGGGITRFKSHISRSDPSQNVKKCKEVPPELKSQIDQTMIKRNNKRK